WRGARAGRARPGARSVRAPFGAAARRSPGPDDSSAGSSLFRHGSKITLPLTSAGTVNPLTDSKPSRLLLLGAPEARPDGLERMLLRVGFAVLDSEAARARAPDVILIGATPNDPTLAERVRELVRDPAHGGASVVVLL